ncbi:MAG TPA: hypothetical protein VLA41_06455 [Burkholderiales bacterium]|nr:hypothetical protein [Burkholderiales bacterium]
MANDSVRKPPNPLIRQVDTLLRNQDAEHEVPVLTEVVDAAASRAALLDPVLLEALARQLERAVLDHFGPEFTRLVEERLARALSARLEQSVAELRDALIAGLDQMAREAVASAIANTFGSEAAPGESAPAPAQQDAAPKG